MTSNGTGRPRSSSSNGPENTFVKNGRMQDEGFRWCLNTFNKHPLKKLLDPDKINLCAKFGFCYEGGSQDEVLCFSCGKSLQDEISPAYPNLHFSQCPLVFDIRNVTIPRPITSESQQPNEAGESGYATFPSLSTSPDNNNGSMNQNVVQARHEGKKQEFPVPTIQMVPTSQLVPSISPPVTRNQQAISKPIHLIVPIDKTLGVAEISEKLKSSDRFGRLNQGEPPNSQQPALPCREEWRSRSDSEIEIALIDRLGFHNVDDSERRESKYFGSPPPTSSDDSDDELRAKKLLNDQKSIRFAPSLTKSQIRCFKTMDLSKEDERRLTFDRWPLNSASADALASSGFYYLNTGVHVQCFFCGVELTSWDEDNDVTSKHQTVSPECRFPRKQMESSLPAHERTVHHPESDKEQATSPTWLRQERGKKQLRCCNPVNPSKRRLEARMNTFDHKWPHKMPQEEIQEIARAGFFYIGEKDRVKCFYCNGGLEDWKEQDDPFMKHASFYPKCEFILQSKGVEYVKNAETSLRQPATSQATSIVPPSHFQSSSKERALPFYQCLRCQLNIATIVVLPCRHMSLCERCSETIDFCPQCQKRVQHTFKINQR